MSVNLTEWARRKLVPPAKGVQRILLSAAAPKTPSPGEVVEHLTLSGNLSIQAADLEAEAADEPPKMVLVSNTGKPMFVGGYYRPVVLDMEGGRFDKAKTPIIAEHDVGLRIGHTTSQAIIKAGKSKKLDGKTYEGPAVVALGVPSSQMGVAQGIVADAKAGFPFQVSVGADIVASHPVEEGEKEVVNGKTFKGPLLVVSKWVIREVSVTVLGADNDTLAEIAAARPTLTDEGEVSMGFESWVENTLGLTLADLTDDLKKKLKAKYDAEQLQLSGNTGITPGQNNQPAQQPAQQSIQAAAPQVDLTAHRAALADDEQRCTEIRSLIGQFSAVQNVEFGGDKMTLGQFSAHAIREGLAANEVELALRRAEVPAEPDTLDGAPFVHMAASVNDLTNETISCAIVRQSGNVPARKVHAGTEQEYGYETEYSNETLEASDHPGLRNLTLHQVLDMMVQRAYGHRYSGNRKSDDFLRVAKAARRRLNIEASGPTSLDVSYVFEDAANKMMLASYNSIGTVWQELCGVKSVSDFKTHNMYRLTHKEGYAKVGVDGTLKTGGFTDEKYTVGLETYGKIVGLNRHHLINDDMGAFNDMMTALGLESAKTIEEVVFMLLLGNTTLFPTDNSNGNYIAGTASELTGDAAGIAAIAAAETLFDNQVDASNAPVLDPADRMLVGTNKRTIAGKLYTESNMGVSGGSSQALSFLTNEYAGKYRPIVSPYVNNTSIKQRVDPDNRGAALGGQSNTQWWLLSNPSSPVGALMYIAFLNGRQTPVLESADAPFDTLGLQWRAYHDFGVNNGDPSRGVYNKGAA